MGSRYSAILRHLGHRVIGIDLPSTKQEIKDALKETSHVIVATPTPTHCDVLVSLFNEARSRINVLCEKPIAKSLKELNHIYDAAKKSDSELFCVNQYAHLPESQFFKNVPTAASYYNYFRSGPDGLFWDCFQIFALATSDVEVENYSPIWTCRINGVLIDLRNMDLSYVRMVQDFLTEKQIVWRRPVVETVTRKILELCPKS